MAPSLVTFAMLVSLTDLSGAPSAILDEARGEVVQMFEDVGVAVEWTAPPGPSTRPDLLQVNVLPYETGALHQLRRAILGAAMRTQAGNAVAWVFYRRIEGEARRLEIPPAQVLACVIAHELAHLLLPLRGHAATGLMRGSWSQRDLRHAATRSLRFSAEEGAQLRMMVEAR